MKNLICTLVGTSLAIGAVAYADPASAQFRGLRDAVRDVKKTTDDAKDVAESANFIRAGLRPAVRLNICATVLFSQRLGWPGHETNSRRRLGARGQKNTFNTSRAR